MSTHPRSTDHIYGERKVSAIPRFPAVAPARSRSAPARPARPAPPPPPPGQVLLRSVADVPAALNDVLRLLASGHPQVLVRVADVALEQRLRLQLELAVARQAIHENRYRDVAFGLDRRLAPPPVPAKTLLDTPKPPPPLPAKTLLDTPKPPPPAPAKSPVRFGDFDD